MTLRIVTLLLAALALAIQTSTPILDPIPEAPIPSGLALAVETFAVFPKSEPIPAPTDPRLVRTARINYLGEIPDGSGRMFVPDINGALYLVTHGTPSVYLDVAKTFAPDFFSGRGLVQGWPSSPRTRRIFSATPRIGKSTTHDISFVLKSTCRLRWMDQRHQSRAAMRPAP